MRYIGWLWFKAFNDTFDRIWLYFGLVSERARLLRIISIIIFEWDLNGIYFEVDFD